MLLVEAVSITFSAEGNKKAFFGLAYKSLSPELVYSKNWFFDLRIA